MAKLVQSWYDRSILVRAGIVWALVFQLVRVVFWYITQNVSVGTMGTANTLSIVNLAFGYLEAAAVVFALLGVVADLFKKRTRKDDGAVKMADGIWMIKK